MFDGYIICYEYFIHLQLQSFNFSFKEWTNTAEIISEIWKKWVFFLFLPTGFLFGFEQTIYS